MLDFHHDEFYDSERPVILAPADAKIARAACEFCVLMNGLLLEAGVISVPIGRGELERVMRNLDAS